MNRIDCRELFFGNKTATAVVTGNTVCVRMWFRGDYMEFDMDIDKIANFLEQCRRSQQTPEN